MGNVRLTPDPGETPGSDAEIMLCPHCLAETGSMDAFCRECGGPVGSMSGIGPIERTLTTGYLLRGGMDKAGSPIVFWGIIGMLIPEFLISTAGLGALVAEAVREPRGIRNCAWLPATLGLLGSFALHGLILAKLVARRAAARLIETTETE